MDQNEGKMDQNEGKMDRNEGKMDQNENATFLGDFPPLCKCKRRANHPSVYIIHERSF